MTDFDKWSASWNGGLLNDPDDSARVARAAAHAAWQAAQPKWQPASVEPFEGQLIVVETSTGNFFTGKYCTKLKYSRCIDSSMRFYAGFERWMPLTTPPEATE